MMDPSKSDISSWKSRWKIYKVDFFGDSYFFRAMNVGEFRKISLIEDLQEKERIILTKGVLWPKVDDLDDLLSGIAERLVLLVSNATNITEETIIQKVGEARDRLGITDNILALQIEIVKNLNYTPDKVDAMSFDEFIDAVVLAEAIVGRPLIAGGLEEPLPESPQADSPGPAPEPIELSNMKDIRQHEGVANENAVRLREMYLRKKRLTHGRAN
jgi:hypothetical protein